MTTICRCAAFILVSLLPLAAFAQEGKQPPAAKKSEDQMIAGAIWSMVDFETNEPLDAQAAFENAAEVKDIQQHLRNIQRKVIDAYRATEIGEDPARNDRDATKIMAANRKAMTVPSIQFASATDPIIVISDASSAGENDWALMKLLFSDDRRVMVRPDNQKVPDPVLNADALSDLGYLTLSKAITGVRKLNLGNHRRQGIFLVVDQPYFETDIAGECFTKGYVGPRDSCIVAFTERRSLEWFHEIHYMNVRIAQILSPIGELGDEQIAAVSPEADLIVVPLASLLDSGGEFLSVVKSSDRQFIVTGTDQETLMRAAKQQSSIVGVIVSDAPTR